MKINEAKINAEIVDMIAELSLYESVCDSDDSWKKYNTGYIEGAINLGTRLKEALKNG